MSASPPTSGATVQLASRVTAADSPADAGDLLSRWLRRALEGRIVGEWEIDCVVRTLSAAAAEARSLGLDVSATARALSIAATQATGLRGLSGTWVGEYQAEESADRGREAARLAQVGLTAPTTGLEGRRGLLALMAPDSAGAPSTPGGDRR